MAAKKSQAGVRSGEEAAVDAANAEPGENVPNEVNASQPAAGDEEARKDSSPSQDGDSAASQVDSEDASPDIEAQHEEARRAAQEEAGSKGWPRI